MYATPSSSEVLCEFDVTNKKLPLVKCLCIINMNTCTSVDVDYGILLINCQNDILEVRV